MPSQDRRNCDANMATVKGRISLRGAVMSCDLLDDGRQVICEDMRHHVQDVCYFKICCFEFIKFDTPFTLFSFSFYNSLRFFLFILYLFSLFILYVLYVFSLFILYVLYIFSLINLYVL